MGPVSPLLWPFGSRPISCGDAQADVVGSVAVGLDAEQRDVQGLGRCEVLDRNDDRLDP
jgi:hypothetical protein